MAITTKQSLEDEQKEYCNGAVNFLVNESRFSEILIVGVKLKVSPTHDEQVISKNDMRKLKIPTPTMIREPASINSLL